MAWEDLEMAGPETRLDRGILWLLAAGILAATVLLGVLSYKIAAMPTYAYMMTCEGENHE